MIFQFRIFDTWNIAKEIKENMIKAHNPKESNKYIRKKKDVMVSSKHALYTNTRKNTKTFSIEFSDLSDFEMIL